MKTLDLIVKSLSDKTSHDSGFIGEQLANLKTPRKEVFEYIVANAIARDVASKLYKLTAGELSLEDIKQIVTPPRERTFMERKSHLFYEI